MIREVDAWIGKTLFHPPIILVCQLLGWNQYRFSRFARIAALVVFIFGSMLNGTPIWALGLFSLLLFITIWSSLHFGFDLPMSDSASTRIIDWALLFYWIFVVFLGAMVAGVIFCLILLFSDYALTIKTIPPREVKERRGVESYS